MMWPDGTGIAAAESGKCQERLTAEIDSLGLGSPKVGNITQFDGWLINLSIDLTDILVKDQEECPREEHTLSNTQRICVGARTNTLMISRVMDKTA